MRTIKVCLSPSLGGLLMKMALTHVEQLLYEAPLAVRQRMADSVVTAAFLLPSSREKAWSPRVQKMANGEYHLFTVSKSCHEIELPAQVFLDVFEVLKTYIRESRKNGHHPRIDLDEWEVWEFLAHQIDAERKDAREVATSAMLNKLKKNNLNGW